MKRRQFLNMGVRSMVLASAAGTGAMSFLPRAESAASGKTVVVVFQRGGCDGLNSVVPYGDDRYYQLRPANIAVAAPNSGNPRSSIRLNDYFGLNPNLGAFREIWDQGHLAVLPAVGYPDSTRSHFEDQEIIEQGATVSTADGWLNRYLAANVDQTGLRAVSLDRSLHQSLRGDVPVSSISDLRRYNTGLSPAEEATLTSDLGGLYDTTAATGSRLRQLVNQAGSVGIRDLAVVNQLDTENYQPADGASYPETGYGRSLASVAQLLKAGVGVEIATIDIGGWDTHSGQGGAEADGSLSSSQREFSEGIGALYRDLGPTRMNDVVIVTMTEFGRTFETNGSGGTDHGIASCWFVVNAGLNGGIRGDWPGLEEDQLNAGRFLDYRTDYRDIFADILRDFLGSGSIGSILPGYSPSSTGLFS